MAKEKEPAVVPELVDDDPFDFMAVDKLTLKRLPQGGDRRDPETLAAEQAVRRQKQLAFLRVYAETGVKTIAARATKVSLRVVYNWIDTDPEFAARLEDAKEMATDALEAECRRRAREGVSEPVFYQGEVVGHVQKYSDLCLLALLNAYRSERFKQRHEHTGKDGGPIAVVHVSYDANMKPDDMP